MLRITESNEDQQIIRLRLDGTITSESYGDLQAVLSAHQAANGRQIVLDMAGVSFMNDAAAQQLARLLGESLQVINCSSFIAALLDAAARTDGGAS